METSLEPMKMKAMMADYPLTHGLHTRSVFSSKVHLELAGNGKLKIEENMSLINIYLSFYC